MVFYSYASKKRFQEYIMHNFLWNMLREVQIQPSFCFISIWFSFSISLFPLHKNMLKSAKTPPPPPHLNPLIVYTWRLVATSGIISARSSRVRFFATPTGVVSCNVKSAILYFIFLAKRRDKKTKEGVG